MKLTTVSRLRGRRSLGQTRPGAPLSIREGVVAAILADMNITAVIGQKLTPVRIPQKDDLPALTFTLVQNVREHDLWGPTGTSWAQFRFDLFTFDPADFITVNEGLRTLFDGFSGSLPGSVIVLETVMDDEHDSGETTDESSGRTTFRTGTDFLFHYRESAPNRVVPNT